MTLPVSGPISLGQVNTELGLSATASVALNNSNVRTLFGKSSGAISLADGRGKSSAWIGRDRVTTNALYGVAYSGTQYVAVGDAGTILTSPDGITWTWQTSGTTLNLRGVTWHGGLFVVVGRSGKILTSPDGVTWTSRTSGWSSDLLAVAWTGSKFVLTGQSGVASASTDGITWTAIASTGGSTYCIASSGSLIVAAGASSRIITSPDGASWTVRSLPINPYYTFNGAAWANGTFVVVGPYVGVGTGASVLTSPDGVTWTQRSTYDGVSWADELAAVMHTGNEFVAVGYSGGIRVSLDGITWTARTSGTTEVLRAVCGPSSRLVAVGNAGTVVTST